MKSIDCKHERASIKCPDCGIDFVGKMTMSSVEPTRDGIRPREVGIPSGQHALNILTGSQPKPTDLAAQIEDARKRIEAWPDDVRVAMGLPKKLRPMCGKPTQGHSVGTCTEQEGHTGHCWFPNMWNDM